MATRWRVRMRGGVMGGVRERVSMSPMRKAFLMSPVLALLPGRLVIAIILFMLPLIS